MNDPINTFCDVVLERSSQHQEASNLLRKRLPIMIAPLIRQEIDSFIKVVYLLTLKDKAMREGLCKRTLENKKWNLAECELVNITDKLIGWTKLTYKFGCAFIHLSGHHGHLAKHPFCGYSQDDRRTISEYMETYHQFQITENTHISDIEQKYNAILMKIHSNLKNYVEKLRSGESIKPEDI